MFLQIFWVIEIVQMDPKSKFKRSHDDFELVSSRERYRDLKVADCEHDGAGLDGRVGELADLTSRSTSKSCGSSAGFETWARGCKSSPRP